jgi:hypothetical protein
MPLATQPDVGVLALHEHADRLFARAIEELRRCHGDVDPVTFAGLVAGLVIKTGILLTAAHGAPRSAVETALREAVEEATWSR